MGFRNAFYFVAFFLFGSLFATDIVTAQTIAYRQANLASNLPNVANNVTPRLVNQSPGHHSSTTFSLGPLVREISSDHILHGDAHSLIYRDLDVAEAAAFRPRATAPRVVPAEGSKPASSPQPTGVG